MALAVCLAQNGSQETRAFLFAAALAQNPSSDHQGQIRPFTATITEKHLTESGAELAFSSTFYKRSDGGCAEFGETEAFGERGVYQRFTDPRRRVHTMVDFFVQAAVAFPLPDDASCKDGIVPVTCKGFGEGRWKVLGTGHLLNMPVIEVEEHVHRDIYRRIWVAPELGCFGLKVVEADAARTRRIIEVLSVRLGEPEAWVFEVPSGFPLVTPLELEALTKQRFGRGGWGDAVAERLERKYWQDKARLERRLVQ